ncbi:hypothetical protein QAD02_021975 [Eretmocerus hayati]|uniref:Uncharacterized protein n=1 Tax=Eretmocerus hayati TaxID=131215 RepID=A0ACC2PRN3_9HYME|nr:hypothetical protein QAD02_021975 [Eretmocerus hayati]
MTSDNRGQPLEPTKVNLTQVNPTIMTSNVAAPTFAKVFANSLRPKREDSIIIDSIEGLTNDDYLDELEMLIDLINVKSISKMSGGGVCIYLANKALVNQLKNKNLHVKDYVPTIKSLINNNKRVVISNVHTSVPDEVIINALKNRGITLVSAISPMRASLAKPGRAHIQSFRRQFYISEKDECNLPDSLQLTHEDTTYWTYLTTDATACFLCKEAGHIMSACPKNDTTQSNSVTNTQVPLEPSNSALSSSSSFTITSGGSSAAKTNEQNNSNEIAANVEIKSNSLNQEQAKLTDTNVNKRPLSSSTSEASSVYKAGNNKAPRQSYPKQKTSSTTKKPKIEDPQEFEAYVNQTSEPASDFFKDNYKGPMTLQQFTDIIIKTHGRRDVREVVLSIVDDLSEVESLIDALYPLIENRRMRTKFTNIKKKLEAPTTAAQSQSEADNECDSDS